MTKGKKLDEVSFKKVGVHKLILTFARSLTEFTSLEYFIFLFVQFLIMKFIQTGPRINKFILLKFNEMSF